VYTISAARAVNPPGEALVLTRAQLWRGLVMKAENALPFVPSMQSCEIIERYPDGFLREIVLRDARMRERIVLTPEIEVRFTRVDTLHAGWIANAIHDSAWGLLLSFSFALRFPGTTDGSVEERTAGDAVRESYLEAIDSTLAAARQIVGKARGSGKGGRP
jgi:hypothetical protein